MVLDIANDESWSMRTDESACNSEGANFVDFDGANQHFSSMSSGTIVAMSYDVT